MPDWNKVLDFNQAVIQYNIDLYHLKEAIKLSWARGAESYYNNVILYGNEKAVVEFLYSNKLPVKGLHDVDIPITLNRPLWGYCRYMTYNGVNQRHAWASVICVGVNSQGNPLDPKILDDNYGQIICSILDWTRKF